MPPGGLNIYIIPADSAVVKTQIYKLPKDYNASSQRNNQIKLYNETKKRALDSQIIGANTSS